MLRKLYDWTLEKAAHRHAAGWLAVFAFVEASFFPIPPHPLLGLMCLAEPKKAIRFAIIATLASVAGGLLGYAIGALLYDTIGQQLLARARPVRKLPQGRLLPARIRVRADHLQGRHADPVQAADDHRRLHRR